MCRVTIYGSQSRRKAILEFLQRKQALDISAEETVPEIPWLTRQDIEDAQAEFLRHRNLGERALAILQQYAPESKRFLSTGHGRKTLSTAAYQKFAEDIPEMRRIAERLIALEAEIVEKHSQISNNFAKIEALQPWLALDIPADYAGAKTTVPLVGSFPESLSAEEIMVRYAALDAPPVLVEVLQQAPQQTCVWALCRREQTIPCEARLRTLGFSRPRLAFKGIPHQNAERLERQNALLGEEIAGFEQEIRSYRGARNALKFLADYATMRAEKYRTLSRLR